MVLVKSTKFWLVLGLLLAFVLRVYSLDYLELFGDEVDAGYQAYSILETGRDYKGNWLPTYMQSFSEWRAPGMMYMMVPFIKIFGLNEWGVRMGSVIFGVISIWLFYVLIKKLGVKEFVAITSVFLLALNPWHIQYSRAGFELVYMISFLLAGLIFLIDGIKENSNRKIVWSALFLSLAIYTYNTANIFVPILSIITLVYFRSDFKKLLLLSGFGILFCTPIIFQMLWGHATDRFGMLSLFNNKEVTAEVIEYRNKSKNTFVSKLIYNKATVGGKRLVFNYTNAFSTDFLFYRGDVTFRHSLQRVGNLYWVMLPLIVVGILSANKYLLLMLLVSPIPASMTIDGFNHASRLFLLVFGLCYLAANGFVTINKNLKYIVVVFVALEFLNYQYYFWNHYRNESWRWWHTGYKKVMNVENIGDVDVDKIYIENTYEPGLIRYLFWNKVDPRKVYGLVDKNQKMENGIEGFCLEKVCFVNYGENFNKDILEEKVLYMISQTKNVGGTRDLENEPLDKVEVVKTIRNFDNTPIFYWVKRV